MTIIFAGMLAGCQNQGDKVESGRAEDVDQKTVLVLTPEQYAIGGNTTLQQIIEAAGYQNAAVHLNLAGQIADRQILEMNPDIILFTQTWTPQQIERWKNAAIYAEVVAVRRNQLYQLPFSIAEDDLDAQFGQRVRDLQMLIKN